MNLVGNLFICSIYSNPGEMHCTLLEKTDAFPTQTLTYLYCNEKETGDDGSWVTDEHIIYLVTAM